MKLQLQGGRLVDPAAGTERVADLFIDDGRILTIGSAPPGFAAERVIDAAGLIVMPGLIDLAARLGESGSELRAAVAGGITRLACPPDTDPPLDEPGLVERLNGRAASLQLARVHPVGALTQGLEGQRLAEMVDLAQAGCVAFSQDLRPLADHLVLLRALQYATTFGFPVWLRPEDVGLAGGGVAHEGEVATRLGLAGVPSVAETVAIATILLLAREVGARIHLCRLSTAEAVRMVRQAKDEGVAVTCDVSAHHVHLSEMDLGFFDADCRLIPPLRSLRDRDALVRGLADGTIDAICSDHTPVADDGKEVPFAEAEPGAIGLELLLPLALKWGAALGQPLAVTLAPVVAGPARVLGLEPPGLAPGATADLCVFDPQTWWRVDADTLVSRGHNTPFTGYELQGRVRYTLVDGRVVHEG